MPKQYMVRDGDTLQRLAQVHLGDAVLWQQLAALNNLDYPYLTEDQDFKTEIPASGTVTFFVNTSRETDLLIPEGTLVWVGGTEKHFRTRFSVILRTGSLSVNASVECVFPGIWGNVGAEDIDSTELDGVSVTNSAPFSNGRVLNVRKTGEFLWIPEVGEEEVYATLALEGAEDEDLMLFDDGDLNSDQYGDIASVVGIRNIAAALKHRLETERGELVLHPGYGSRLHQLIGRKEPFVQKMIELDIMETALQDSRIQKVEVLSAERRNDRLEVTLVVEVQGEHHTIQFSALMGRG